MFTFGIITNNQHHTNTTQEDRLSTIIQSIKNQNIPEYEIIIVGDYQTNKPFCKCISFDETIKTSWITKKKNIITQEANYNNIVYLHDYIYLDNNWYNGWKRFGIDNWDIAMNIIMNKDGSRFRDWCVLWFDGNVGPHGTWPNDIPNTGNRIASPYIPEYNYNQQENLYISGSYWIAKKCVMLEEPLDEKLSWSQSEDIEWSYRVLKKYKYVMNQYSIVRLLHQKDRIFKPLNEYYVSQEYIRSFNE